jgi:hypothetical protein
VLAQQGPNTVRHDISTITRSVYDAVFPTIQGNYLDSNVGEDK